MLNFRFVDRFCPHSPVHLSGSTTILFWKRFGMARIFKLRLFSAKSFWPSCIRTVVYVLLSICVSSIRWPLLLYIYIPHNSLRLLYIVNYLSFYSEDGSPLRTHNWIWTIQRSIDARLFKWTVHEPTQTHTWIHIYTFTLIGKKAFEPDIFNYHSSIQLFWALCKHTWYTHTNTSHSLSLSLCCFPH